MIKRTENPNTKGYKNYGGRGITVYSEWRWNFENFYIWAINHGYREDLSIDRVDVNGDYCPENCRWITQKEQCQNMRKSVKVAYEGKILSLSQWSEELGINYMTLWHRIFTYGWPVKKAFETPVNKRKSHKKK